MVALTDLNIIKECSIGIGEGPGSPSVLLVLKWNLLNLLRECNLYVILDAGDNLVFCLFVNRTNNMLS